MLGSLSASELVVVLISIILSLSIHEAMHGYAAYLLGDDTAQDMGRLTLNPLKHIDPFMTVVLPLITLLIFHLPILAAKPVPFNPQRVKYGEFGGALIAAAGPFSNLVLAFIGAIFANHIFLGNSFWDMAFSLFTILNVAILVFNLLPIPPLDGSRVLYAFAPESLQRFMISIEPYGLFLIFGLVLTAGLGGFLSDLNQFVLNLLP